MTDDELNDVITAPPQVVDWERFIVSDPGTVSGRLRVKETRLSVEFILNLFAAGWTEDQVLESYPALSRDAIWAVFAYAASRVGSTSKTPR